MGGLKDARCLPAGSTDSLNKELAFDLCVSKCPTGYLCGENPIYNESNLQPNSDSHVKAKHFLLGFNTH